MYKYSIGIFLGIGIAFAASVGAQTFNSLINPKPDLIFKVPINSETELPVMSEAQWIAKIQYGRLDYISKQIKDLQDRKCVK